MLGPGNAEAAAEALAAYPGGLQVGYLLLRACGLGHLRARLASARLTPPDDFPALPPPPGRASQVGGGVTLANAAEWLAKGASHVIVTSFVFAGGEIRMDNLRALVDLVGRDCIVLDLSCRKRPPKEATAAPARGPGSGGEEAGAGGQAKEGSVAAAEGGGSDDDPYYVVTDRWQTFTSFKVTAASLAELSAYCAEFLVHGVEAEGKRCGVLEDLVALLAASPIPCTYAGGVRGMADLDRVRDLGRGRVDLTVGSALDVFGGSMPYADVVAWHNLHNGSTSGAGGAPVDRGEEGTATPGV